MRKLVPILLCLLSGFRLSAQEPEKEFTPPQFFSLPDEPSGEYLDTVKVPKLKLNDYWMIGAFGGVSMEKGFFNPDRYTNLYLNYPAFGVSIARYATMFGVFPNMGTELGVMMDYEGYEFKEYESNGQTYRSTTDGAYSAVMRVPEAFLLSHFHAEFGDHFKGMLKIGLYGGYRIDVHREGPAVAAEYVNGFTDHDKRWSYGVRAGLGFGLVFEPVEIHIMGMAKWGWSPYYAPDYYSPYYYRYAYPLNFNVTLGVYFHLSKRYGRSHGELRRLARETIQNEQNGDIKRSSR